MRQLVSGSWRKQPIFLCLSLVRSMAMTSVSSASPPPKPFVYDGRIVATPLPDRWSVVRNNKVRTLPNNPSAKRQINPCLVNGYGSLQVRPSSHSASRNESNAPNSQKMCSDFYSGEAGGDYENCSFTKLDVFVYDKDSIGSTQLELNRDSAELASATLKRMSLNLKKRLQTGKAAKKPAKKIDFPTPSVWIVDENNISVSQVDIVHLTSAELWNMARKASVAIQMQSPIDMNHDMCFLVESSPPCITTVRTFEDFTPCLFPGVPIFVEVDTLYSTHTCIAWFINGELRNETWNEHCFVPTELDVDSRVTILITPSRTKCADSDLHAHDGKWYQQAYKFSKTVEPLPSNTLLEIRSQWRAQSGVRRKHDRSFRIVTYNILAHQNAFTKSNNMPFYPYVSSDILSKGRRFPLILQELLSYEADVICLQEVDESVYYRFLEPTLEHYGYQGYYSCKTTDGTREGCAMCWSLKTFLPVAEEKQKCFAYGDLVTNFGSTQNESESAKAYTDLLDRRKDLWHILSTRLGHVVQMVPLLPRCAPRERPIWISNTHLFFHPLGSHIRLLQMYLMAYQLDKELEKIPGDCMVCGDFNSSLQNSAGKLLLDRSVPKNYRDNKSHLNCFQWGKDSLVNEDTMPNDDFPKLTLPESFPKLESAIQPTPSFTHLIDGFQGTLDHVLMSTTLQSVESAPMPSTEDVTIDTAMPSPTLPSDHVSLICDIIQTNVNE